MCSIMGYCDCCAAPSLFKQGFDQTISRGPDDSRIVDTGRGLLGFHRLAIMGLTPEGMQPFELDGSYARVQRRDLRLRGARSARFRRRAMPFSSGCRLRDPAAHVPTNTARTCSPCWTPNSR